MVAYGEEHNGSRQHIRNLQQRIKILSSQKKNQNCQNREMLTLIILDFCACVFRIA